jgi:oligopeptide transport system substrate-binding protein
MVSRQRIGRVLLSLFVLAALVAPVSGQISLAADAQLILTSPLVPAAQVQESEPVTFNEAGFEFVSTLDPQKVEDAVSVDPVENLFLGLTDVDPKTTQVRPEAATKWERSADGLTWTFTLRDDIPWVRYDPNTKQTTDVRKVTAGDFEYGIKRSCDPRLGAYYTSVAAALIKGCDVVARLDNPQDSDFDQIEVRALSDTQLQITARAPFGFFLSSTAMWMFRAVPREVIAEFGDLWTEPGNIVTNGPYVIDVWDQFLVRQYVKNPLFPDGVTDRYGGNVERVITYMVDGSTAYGMYQNGELDTSFAPFSELNRLRADPELSKEIIQRTELATYYFGYMYDKPPFDNVHVRRAFSAILDRRAFVDSLIGSLGVPIAHFMPPGIRGAVGLNEVGVGAPENLGFDPDYARRELAEGGYPDCANFPDVTLLTYLGASDWAQWWIKSAEIHLGCDPSKFNIEEAEFTFLIRSIKKDLPTAQRPNAYTLGWAADYPDAHNWMHDVLGCNADNPFRRPCSEVDKKIDEAARLNDPEARNGLYRQIEEGFFGQSGEFPIAPLYVNVDISLIKPWVQGFFATDALFGGVHWDVIQIDQAAQLAARAGGE